jgi:glycosyltransferase involved in cell wall biosynthesis
MLDLHHEYGLFDDTPCTLLPYGIEHGSADHTLVVEDTSSKDTSQELRLLFVGQLTAQKGALWLVNAIDMMNRTDVRLDVLGKGPQMEEIKKIAAESEVIHIHGFVTGSDLDEFYKLADATVVSSKWYDNSPMVIYESYFQGTPVIGANIGGIPELIEEGRTGFLFNPNDQNSLQNAIESAIKTDNGKLRKGVEEVRKRYTMDKHFTELLSEYEATIN